MDPLKFRSKRRRTEESGSQICEPYYSNDSPDCIAENVKKRVRTNNTGSRRTNLKTTTHNQVMVIKEPKDHMGAFVNRFTVVKKYAQQLGWALHPSTL